MALADSQNRPGRLWTHPMMLFILALSVFPMLAFNWLPVLFNIFGREFNANLEQQGTTQQYMYIAGLVLVVGGGWLTEKIGDKWSAFVAILSCACGLLIIGSSPTLSSLYAGSFTYGFGIAWMYLIYGVLVGRYFSEQLQKAYLINNMVLALVGGIGPALLGYWISKGLGWRHAFFILAAVNILFAVFFVAWFREKKQAPPSGVKSETKEKREVSRHPIFALGMWLIGIAYILHGVAEIGAVSWLAKLYYQRHVITEEQMGLMISTNVVAFAVGRFLLTFIADRFRDRMLLGLCAAGGTLFFSCVLLTHNYYLGFLCMGISGAFMSGNAPAMNSYLGDRFKATLPHAFAIFSGFGAIGSAVAPRLIGYIGDHAGLEKAVWLIPACSGVLMLLAFLWEVSERVRPQAVT